MSKTSAALLTGLLAVMPLAATAQVYKCTQAGGSVSYQSTPCAQAGAPAAHPTAAQLNAQRPPTRTADAEPYVDPYATGVSSRPHPVAPQVRLPPSPDARPAAVSRPSDLVADVQARNRRETQLQALQEAHKHDNTVERQLLCNQSKKNVYVLKQADRPFTLDNQANPKYVEGKEREAALAREQQQMAEHCN